MTDEERRRLCEHLRRTSDLSMEAANEIERLAKELLITKGALEICQGELNIAFDEIKRLAVLAQSDAEPESYGDQLRRVMKRQATQSDAGPAAWQSQVRPEVAAFAILMEEELRNNDNKMGWKDSNPCNLCDRVQDEATELRDIVRKLSVEPLSEPRKRNYKNRISSEAADVANMAMMVADVCGALPVHAAPPRPSASAGLIEAAGIVEGAAKTVPCEAVFTEEGMRSSLNEIAMQLRARAADRSGK